MRLPNGYGGVSKLNGKRRRPWRARITTGWEIDPETKKEKQIYKTIGCYETKQAALKALADYNTNPFETSPEITFAEVYDRWARRKFDEISDSNIAGYKAAYKLCAPIYNIRFCDLKLIHLQTCVDQSGKNYPTLKKLKIMLNQVFDYAVQNEIIGKNKHVVEYLNIGKPTKSDKHYRFNDAEIETLWRWSPNNEYVQLILMLVYTGVRPGELFAVKTSRVDLDDKSFYIDKGKNDNAVRKVPIHDRVLPFFRHWMSKGNEYLVTQRNGARFRFDTNHGQYVDSYWTPILRDMGILEYRNDRGDMREHSPDDTRHTFTTMWREKRLDEAMRRKIQGHSGKGIGEMVYTHFEFEKLREELNKL